jgi:hypothetical protein
MAIFQAFADQNKNSIVSLVNSQTTTGTGCKCPDATDSKCSFCGYKYVKEI